MIIDVEDSREALYQDILSLLRDLKVTQGPVGVNATLSRHKDIKQFLIDCQTRKISNISEKMTLDN